jgi:hypothetical protein
MQESVERIAAARPLVVGDRLDTDVEAGHRTGLPSLLVLTGVTDVARLLDAPAHQRPTYVAADLRGLGVPARDLLVVGGAGGADDGLAVLRAAAARAWTAADVGDPAQIGADGIAALERDVAAALAR